MDSPAPNALQQRVRALVATVVGLKPEQVPVDAIAGDFAPWTSLAQIEIMMGMEAEFGVSAPSHMLADLMSIELIADFLRSKGVKESG